jgi:hypothetical protein
LAFAAMSLIGTRTSSVQARMVSPLAARKSNLFAGTTDESMLSGMKVTSAIRSTFLSCFVSVYAVATMRHVPASSFLGGMGRSESGVEREVVADVEALADGDAVERGLGARRHFIHGGLRAR